MLDAFVLDGTVTLLALAALAIELAVVLGVAVMQGRAPAGDLLANLLSGLFLILALRAALLAQGSGPVALCLGLAGAAHLTDVILRLRRRR